MNDHEQLRRAFGTYLTGVTVVTTRAPDGSPVGFTANSFTSVSLEPPLLLVCLANNLNCMAAFAEATHFAVNILSAGQQDVSNIFAACDGDRFEHITQYNAASGSPMLDDCSAWFDCEVFQRVVAGDHTIYIGKVLDYRFEETDPLGYSRNGYFSLHHEQQARQLHEASTDVVTGYLIEVDDGLVVEKRGDHYVIPQAVSGASLGKLQSDLQRAGIEQSAGMLYSTFQYGDRGNHAVYYRCRAKSAPTDISARFHCMPIADLPIDSFERRSVRSMLQRFQQEHASGSYGIYHGTETQGEVTLLGGDNSHVYRG